MNDTHTRARDAGPDIDAIAREMTQGDPGPGFDGRVMTRLEPRASAGAWLASGRSMRWAAAVVLLALGATWIATMREGAVPVREAMVAGSPAPVNTPTLSSALLDDAPAAPARGPAPGPDRAAVAMVPELSKAEAEWLSRRVPELTTPARVTIESIQPTDAAIPLLEVTPLTPARVALRPLGETNPGAVR